MHLDASIAAVITGGASGLGAATARRLARHGVKIALFDLNAELGEQVAGEIGGVFCQVDVTSDTEVEAGFVQAHGRRSGRSAFWSTAPASAALSRPPAAIARPVRSRHYPLDHFERVIQVNLIGTFRCIAKSAAGHADLARPRRR